MPAIDLIRTVDSLSEVLTSTASFFREHRAEIDGSMPTDCEGWSVQDHLSHMVGLEQVLGGAPLPTIELPPLSHVSTELDAYMELPVEVRRPLPLVSVVDELAGMTPRRVSQYRELVDLGDPDVLGPLGSTRSLSVALPRRVFDLWTHEQDIRRACGYPVREPAGATASLIVENILSNWESRLSEFITTEGVLRISVQGEGAADLELVFGGGGPVAVLGLDVAELYRLGCGRGDFDEILRGATVAGARGLIDEVLPHMSFTA